MSDETTSNAADENTATKDTPPLPWAPMTGVAAIWLLGWLNCSLDISTPFPDITAGEVCAVAPGIGLKWTDLLLAVISGIISAGWAESRLGPGTQGSSRHVRSHRKSEVKARLWFMAGFGSYFIFATIAGLMLYNTVSLFYGFISAP